MTIVSRTTKGSALTYAEMDENIRDLHEDTNADRVGINTAGDNYDRAHVDRWYEKDITVSGDSNWFYPIGIVYEGNTGTSGKTHPWHNSLTNLRIYRNYNWHGPAQNEPSSWSSSTTHQGGLVVHLNFWESSWSDMYDRQVWQYRRTYHTSFAGTWKLNAATEPNSANAGVFLRGGFRFRVACAHPFDVRQITPGSLAYPSTYHSNNGNTYTFYHPDKIAYADRDTKWDGSIQGGVHQ